MSFCELNGYPIAQATIAFPRVGAWVADLVVDTDQSLDGQVTLTYGAGAYSWKGTVHRGGSPYGTGLVRIVGGADGLETVLAPQGYRACNLRLPIADICNACGETLAASSDGTLLAQQLPQWARLGVPGRQALKSLLDAQAASWRILPDGTLWIGSESWPANTDTWTTVSQLPELGRSELSSDTMSLQPGQTLADSDGVAQQVSYVRYDFTEHLLRATVWYEDPA